MKRIVLCTAMLIATTFILSAQTEITKTKGDNSAITTTITNNSEITFDKIVYDYGSVNQGADGDCEFTFTNTGTEPLILSEVKTSCGCTLPSWTKEPVLPGKTGSVKAKYTKMNVVGPFERKITVASNAKNGTIVLTIKGKVLESPENITPEKESNDGSTPIAK